MFLPNTIITPLYVLTQYMLIEYIISYQNMKSIEKQRKIERVFLKLDINSKNRTFLGNKQLVYSDRT
ncbi:hypothetical protein CFB3_41800 [Clostridium folliculivorans]|uniref:Uncharacterized protein n=1 Tax=Clostridium folliculivorans TaxID=2886038 RepID=A0A9W6DC46_9CLOT|nr:hypothetical protein CFOLD11_32000 [Clostridium folliculivorans]GKU32072.1 hypothetical protein CFB3_41800 [Clostridium folliculivorans]